MKDLYNIFIPDAQMSLCCFALRRNNHVASNAKYCNLFILVICLLGLMLLQLVFLLLDSHRTWIWSLNVGCDQVISSILKRGTKWSDGKVASLTGLASGTALLMYPNVSLVIYMTTKVAEVSSFPCTFKLVMLSPLLPLCPLLMESKFMEYTA